MGIAGFALMVMFSLMPTGAAVMHDAARQIAEAEIFNRISSELASTPLYNSPTDHTINAMSSYTGTAGNRFPVYFDIEGNELPTATSAPANAVFTVRANVTYPSTGVWSSTNGPPGSGTASSGGNFHEMCYGIVLIGFHQDPGTTVNSSNRGVTSRTFLFANRGNSTVGVTN